MRCLFRVDGCRRLRCSHCREPLRCPCPTPVQRRPLCVCHGGQNGSGTLSVITYRMVSLDTDSVGLLTWSRACVVVLQIRVGLFPSLFRRETSAMHGDPGELVVSGTYALTTDVSPTGHVCPSLPLTALLPFIRCGVTKAPVPRAQVWYVATISRLRVSFCHVCVRSSCVDVWMAVVSVLVFSPLYLQVRSDSGGRPSATSSSPSQRQLLGDCYRGSG